MEGVQKRIDTVWIPLVAMLLKFYVQVIFTTATMPPDMVQSYRQLLGRYDFNIIRVSSDRSNVAFHMIPSYPEPFPARRDYHFEDVVHALIRVFTALITESSTPNDRILVFFSRTQTVETFAEAHNYLWHSSKRGKIGLDATLAAWDDGTSRVLVGTTSLAQGLDRPNVRIVIVANAVFGHTTLTQMLGRAGRNGLPADLFFIAPNGTDKRPPYISNDPSVAAQLNLNAEAGCQRRFSMEYMDGPGLKPYSCHDSTAHPCGNCAPNDIHLTTVLAVREAQKIQAQMQNRARASDSNVRASRSTASLSTISSRAGASSMSSIESFPSLSPQAQNAGVDPKIAQGSNVRPSAIVCLHLLISYRLLQTRFKTLTENRDRRRFPL